MNVNNRIKIVFGKEYGIVVESEPDEGTTVSICIPAVLYTEENRKALEGGNLHEKENEQKKEFLQSYQLAKRDVTRLEEQLAELRIGKMSPGCDIGDGLPHAHNATDLSGYAAKVDELEDEIIAARYQRILAYQQVRNCIEALEDEREKMLTYLPIHSRSENGRRFA